MAETVAAVMWDVCLEICREVQTIPFKSDDFSIPDNPTPDVDFPFVYTLDAGRFQKACPALVAAADAQYKSFKNKPDFTTTKRSNRKLVGDSLKQAMTVFKALLPKDQVAPPDSLKVGDNNAL